jgi:NAD(P)H-hydrate epimerase
VDINGKFISSNQRSNKMRVLSGMIAVSADQMRRVDEIAVRKYGILLVQMMELAGFHLASLIKQKMGGSIVDKRIVILAGKGNNGGGGLVAARFLSNWEGIVEVILSQEEVMNDTVKKRLLTLESLPINISTFQKQSRLLRQVSNASVIIDALIGYNLKGDPRLPISTMIFTANKSRQMIVSLDLPTGLDASTGIHYSPCIDASCTMTLGLPKQGLMVPEARKVVGELYLADIGIPATVYRDLGLDLINPFPNAPIIRLY